MRNNFKPIPSFIPVLAVDDVTEAIAFYSQLGFAEEFSLPNPQGQLVHAHLRKGDSVLFLGRLDVSHYAGHRRAELINNSQAAHRGIGITLILQVENLSTLYQFVLEKGLAVLSEPHDEYYGDHVFFFLDPFGYEWKISQAIETRSHESTSHSPD